MRYFTNASTQARVRLHQLPHSIDVIDSPSIRVPIGTAVEVGELQDGQAIWRLEVNGNEVPGLWVIVDGMFMAVGPNPG
jgi:hypothetical protein